MATRLLTLILVSALLAGCTIRGGPTNFPPRDDPDFAVIYIGGVHPKWGEEGLVFVGYAINTHVEPLMPERRGVVATYDSSLLELEGTRDPGLADIRFDMHTPWEPGEVRQFEFSYPEAVKTGSYDYGIDISSEDGRTQYRYGCFNQDGRIFDIRSCPIPNDPTWISLMDEELTPEKESLHEAFLLECCAWLFPPLDIDHLTCDVVDVTATCRFTLTNWHNTTHEAAGELLVWADDAQFVRHLAIQESLEPLGALQAGEVRELEVKLDLTELATSEKGTTYEVEVLAGRAELPKSRTNATTPLRVGGIPLG